MEAGAKLPKGKEGTMAALTLLTAFLFWLGIPSPALPNEPPKDLVMTIKPVSFSDEVGGFTAELDAPFAARYVFRVLVSLGRPEKEAFPKVAIIAGIAVPEGIKFRFSPPEMSYTSAQSQCACGRA